MKSLYNYIKEAEEINISKSIDYNQFSELFLFINNSQSLMDNIFINLRILSISFIIFVGI